PRNHAGVTSEGHQHPPSADMISEIVTPTPEAACGEAKSVPPSRPMAAAQKMKVESSRKSPTGDEPHPIRKTKRPIRRKMQTCTAATAALPSSLPAMISARDRGELPSLLR